MRAWLWRWYRWMFNPKPLAGQRWVLDGIGIVEVGTREWRNGKWWCSLAYPDGKWRWLREGEVRLFADPWKPKAADLLGVDREGL